MYSITIQTQYMYCTFVQVARLEKMCDDIIESSGPSDERLTSLNDRLDELDPKTFETKARKVSAHPFETACLPLKHSSNPGVHGMSERGALRRSVGALRPGLPRDHDRARHP
jgi:hypothetical protein